MYKFPSTPHLANLGSISIRDDKVFSEEELSSFLAREIVVEEKVDGANLGISFNESGNIVLQNRGNLLFEPYLGQWKKLDEWLNFHIDKLFDVLGMDKILFGEWCFARHSILYKSLPDWFIGFDVYDESEEKFLATRRRNQVFQQAGIIPIAELGRGFFTLDSVLQIMDESQYTDAPCEGLYLRQEDEHWLLQRAKLVRAEFVQSIETHWSKRQLEANKTLK
ncbi:MAG: RNA ligase family protein [Candidatus Cloacimonadaceae bacterium]